MISFLSANMSTFTDLTDVLLEAVVLAEEGEEEALPELLDVLLDDEVDEDPDGEVVPTVGVATLVPEVDPVDAAKAFPETRSPTRTVAIPVVPMAMEMDFLGTLCITLSPFVKPNKRMIVIWRNPADPIDQLFRSPDLYFRCFQRDHTLQHANRIYL